MPGISKIEVNKTNLNDLLHDVAKKGVIRIPHFQRDYVWENAKVKDLFDSMYKQFPIGSFFFWIVPSKYRNLYKELPELKLPSLPKHDQIRMVLDGQQRITSLLCVAYGKKFKIKDSIRDYRKICFDLDKKEFIIAKRGEDKEKIISAFRFFEDNYDIYNNLSNERKTSFNECKEIIINYPISIVEVEDKDLEDAIEIFERINQGGKRLNLFDLVVAGTWSPDFDLRNKVNEFNKELEKKGFGKIENETIPQIYALFLNGQCTRSFQLKLRNKYVKDNWDTVSKGISMTIDFLSKDLGVVTNEFIPYPSMIAMISYFFIKNNLKSLDSKQSEFIEDWFWKTAFSQRYSASTLTLMGRDRADYFDKALKRNYVEIDYPITLTSKDIQNLIIYKRSAVKNAILCLLAKSQPRHFKNNSLVILDKKIYSEINDPEKHHIFPRSFLRKKGFGIIHSLPNFTFIPSELNKEILSKDPSRYFKNYKRINPKLDNVLDSHLIPKNEDSGIWNNDYNKFLEQRSKLIVNEIKKLVGNITDLEIFIGEDSNKAVDKIEKKLREYINRILLKKENDYWPLISKKVQLNIEERLNQEKKKYPYKNKENDNFYRLEFCNIMDYHKIIEHNWNLFKDDFGLKEELKKHFINLKEYRNALKHAREMDNVLEKLGEASMEWIYMIINKDNPNKDKQRKSVNKKIEIAKVRTYEDHFTNNMSETKELFLNLRDKIFKLDDRIKENPNPQSYIGYKINRNICAIHPRINSLRAELITVDEKDLKDPKDKIISKDWEKNGWTKCCDYNIESKENIDYFIFLFKQVVDNF